MTSAPVPEELVTLTRVHARGMTQTQCDTHLRRQAGKLQADGIYAVVYTVEPQGVQASGTAARRAFGRRSAEVPATDVPGEESAALPPGDTWLAEYRASGDTRSLRGHTSGSYRL